MKMNPPKFAPQIRVHQKGQLTIAEREVAEVGVRARLQKKSLPSLRHDLPEEESSDKRPESEQGLKSQLKKVSRGKLESRPKIKYRPGEEAEHRELDKSRLRDVRPVARLTLVPGQAPPTNSTPALALPASERIENQAERTRALPVPAAERDHAGSLPVPSRPAPAGVENGAAAGEVSLPAYPASPVNFEGNLAPITGQSMQPPRRVDITMCKDGDNTHVTIRGDTSTLLQDFGTNSLDFLDGLIQQISNAGSNGPGPDEIGTKFMFAYIKEQKPRDTYETLLCAQMAALHLKIMHYTHRMAHAESSQEEEFAGRSVSKLMRAFVPAGEALRRHRAKEQIRPVIQYVSVGDGSRAVVGMQNGVSPRPVSVSEAGRPLPSADLAELATALPTGDTGSRPAGTTSSATPELPTGLDLPLRKS